ncbi:MAG: hypothetical protein WAX77_12240 [Methylococcaceae bacterium]
MLDKLVIDTNVLIAANGRNTHACFACQLACIELLEECKNSLIALDDLDLIMDEYKAYCNYSGQPNTGDMFFKYLHDNQHSVNNIYRITITPIDDEARGFLELPINTVDKSDRKFVATALIAPASIMNATDSDWVEQKLLLDNLNITVKQLCPEHSCK